MYVVQITSTREVGSYLPVFLAFKRVCGRKVGLGVTASADWQRHDRRA
jgi:hypothetical protein